MKSYVYFILDPINSCIKIGKANDVKSRIRDLQVGNPNELELLATIKCHDESTAFKIESQLHSSYPHLYLRGEWFKYEDSLRNFISEQFKNNSKGEFVSKKTRESLIISSLFEGESTKFNVDMFPRCFFYPDKPAQIMTNYEDAQKLSVPWRKMVYPTNGQYMLKLPDGTLLSNEVDRVFISGKKHEENLKLKRYLSAKNETTVNLLEFT